FVDGGEVRLQTRNLLDCTKQYPEAHGAAEALTGAYQAILDGEIVAFDERGVPSFQRLQPRMHLRDESAVSRLRKSVPVIYEVFDLLYLDGDDLTRQPLRERRRRLEAALEPMGAIRLSEGFPGNGVALFRAVQDQGPTSPFAVAPKVNQPATWCFPDLVCEVRYAEMTRDGTLRHPVYLGLRSDIDPKDCTGQEIAASAKEAQRKAEKAARSDPPA